MNIEVLEKIKVIEDDHTLKILVINHNADILVSDLIQLKNLGEIIKIARNKLNLTLSDLSRISDISEIELW